VSLLDYGAGNVRSVRSGSTAKPAFPIALCLSDANRLSNGESSPLGGELLGGTWGLVDTSLGAHHE
jgi:hypothetical protein